MPTTDYTVSQEHPIQSNPRAGGFSREKRAIAQKGWVGVLNYGGRLFFRCGIIRNLPQSISSVGITKKAARRAIERILQWYFERVILAHGDLIETDAKAVLRKAWVVPL